jgi:hypothetical protein
MGPFANKKACEEQVAKIGKKRSITIILGYSQGQIHIKPQVSKGYWYWSIKVFDANGRRVAADLMGEKRFGKFIDKVHPEAADLLLGEWDEDY